MDDSSFFLKHVSETKCYQHIELIFLFQANMGTLDTSSQTASRDDITTTRTAIQYSTDSSENANDAPTDSSEANKDSSDSPEVNLSEANDINDSSDTSEEDLVESNVDDSAAIQLDGDGITSEETPRGPSLIQLILNGRAKDRSEGDFALRDTVNTDSTVKDDGSEERKSDVEISEIRNDVNKIFF